MNFSLYWKALRARPRAVLMLEEAKATFSIDENRHTATLHGSPAAYLLTPAGDIALPLRLRDFINEQSSAFALQPFELIGVVPETLPDPGRCGSQLAALLHAMGLPAYAVTTNNNTRTCLFTDKLPPRPLPLRLTLITILASTAALYFSAPPPAPGPAPLNAVIKENPATGQKAVPRFFDQRCCLAVCSVLYHAQRCCVAVFFKKTKDSAALRCIAKTPRRCTKCITMVARASGQRWRPGRTRYCPGFPPLYECRSKN